MSYETFLKKCVDIERDPRAPWIDYMQRDIVLMEKWEPSDKEHFHYFASLDKTLEVVWPTISLLQYNKLLSRLSYYDDFTESDYYYSKEWKCRYVIVEELYEYLKREGRYDINL